ncbi:hypothetical protein FQA39_LY14533 [Lamprigera yunnana]|nr:hypothetical protein FQA39_LY14533 [Lamprigera yunnana]
MASGSDSEDGSQRSLSPTAQGPAPTPGYGLDRSRSNSPDFQTSERSKSRSPSADGSESRSRSPSAGSQRSNSAASDHSNRSSRRSRSGSAASNKSQRSGSAGSGGSNKSQNHRSRSGSSHSSGSRSNRSRSGSRESNKSQSGSEGTNKSRANSRGSASNRSRSGSKSSHRSSSKGSTRSRSGSSRSRSASAESNKSHDSHRSKSAELQRSKSRSQSRESESGRSRSPSETREHGSQNNSHSNSPNLQINVESPGSDIGVKRKRGSSEEPNDKKKYSKLIDSDSEEACFFKDKEEPNAAALFGDADDISSEEEKDKERTDARGSDEDSRDRLSEADGNDQRPAIEDDEEKEPEPEPIPETRIDVEIPKISCDLGRDIHFVKLPNFLSVETRPFDQETYEDEIDEEETLDEEGRARLKLKVENTIRWREDIDKEGNTIKESNARFVRWSDGSLSLHLGSEIFDVYKQPLQGDHNHLFIRQGTGLQGQAVFRTKLSFRPHSTESFTHRKMTLSLADRSQKVSGIKILSQVGVDPDQDRKSLLKKEEEKLRQTIRVTKTRKRGEGGARSHQREAFREEEGSDEDGAISLNAIKNKYKSGAATTQSRGGGIYSSDEEGSDFEARRVRKLDKTKALKDSDTSESE